MAGTADDGTTGYTTRFLPGLALLPTFAAAITLTLYLAEWPDTSEGGVVAVGLGAAIVVWIVVSLLFFGPFTRIESAMGDTYDNLITRTLALRSRIDACRSGEQEVPSSGRAAAVGEAERMVESLEGELTPGGPASTKWLLATGYVNLWRRVHRAEEALLEVAAAEDLHIAALRDRRVLGRPADEETVELSRGLEAMLGPAEPGSGEATRTREEVLAALDTPGGRVLVRAAEHRVHSRRNDLWDKLVNLRNRLVATLFLTTLGIYAILVVAVLRAAPPDALAGAAVLFAVGAGVGLFRELYTTSRLRVGMVFDYGLGYARLMTIPVLSGTAALGGVVLTRLLSGTGTDVPTLSGTFSLTEYPWGIVVAAGFGLTPGMLLERLRSSTEAYEDRITPAADPRTAGGGEESRAP